ALGFVDRPLYLFPEFMATKPVEILIREGLKAEDFNDDVLGRTLDKLYRASPEGIFMRIAANAYGEYSGRFLHNDTTSMSLQGEHEHEEGDIDAVPIRITHGYSRDHRPDLKQFVISLVMSDSLPVFIRALSGNASDKNHFREIVKEYGRSLQEKRGEDKIWVWDSAGYSEKNLQEISKSYKWIMRVPETLSEAKEVLENADTEKMRSTTLDGYRLFSTEVEYGGVKQHWVVVFSEKAFEREMKTLEKKMKKEKERERGMASLQSAVLQRGRRTEDCTGERKAVEVPRDKRNCDGDEEEGRKRGTGETRKRRAYTDGIPRKSGACGG
ncbi:IS1634 family transposase, partial [Methanophagales archaeon]